MCVSPPNTRPTIVNADTPPAHTLKRPATLQSRKPLMSATRWLASVPPHACGVTLEGDLVPTCACGWRGYPEPWRAPRARSWRGGQQHISHETSVTMEQATQRFAARTAAARSGTPPRPGREARASASSPDGWRREPSTSSGRSLRRGEVAVNLTEHLADQPVYHGGVWAQGKANAHNGPGSPAMLDGPCTREPCVGPYCAPNDRGS